MKLLLDENLSRRLVPFLQNDFPGTTQVNLIGLEHASDQAIWDYARDNDFAVTGHMAENVELLEVDSSPPTAGEPGHAGQGASGSRHRVREDRIVEWRIARS